MKAYTITKYGNQPLTLTDLPTPTPGANEVLVKIKAASVNPIDLKIKSGFMRPIMATHLPLTLGHDFVGEVVQLGSQVTAFKLGERVFGKLDDWRIGSFAEYAVAQTTDIAVVPAALTDVQAAAIPLVGLTAYQALHEYLAVQPGQRVYIPAGAGGVGSLAIPLAAAMGAQVITTASAKNTARLKQLGATTVLDYHDPQLFDHLGIVDAAFDLRGGKELRETVKHIKRGGGIVTLNAIPNQRFVADQADYYQLSGFKRALLTTLALSMDRRARRAGIHYRFMLVKSSGAQLTTLTNMLLARGVMPTVDRTFTFEETQQALDFVATGHAHGKVVITHDLN